MSHDETDDYIPVELVADLLDVSKRQASRYAEKVRTQQDGRRILYHRGDIERLAQEKGVKHNRPLAPHTEIMPPGRLVDLLAQIQQDNARLNHEVGRLTGLLEAQQQRAEIAEQALRQLTSASEAEAARLRAELDQARRSWWQRLRGK